MSIVFTPQKRLLSPCYFLFLNSLGVNPFILLKKRAKVVTSAKWSCSEIWVTWRCPRCKQPKEKFNKA